MRSGLRVLLVAEFYGSGGTHTYVRQLLHFYASHQARVTLVTLDDHPDPEITLITSAYGFDVVSVREVMSTSRSASPEETPPVWSWIGMTRERRAFRAFANTVKANCVVVSAGTPGMFLGALGAVPRGLYILHTYPHGRRQQLLGPSFMSRFLPNGALVVSVSDFEKRAIERLWRPGKRNINVVTIKNTCGPLQPEPVMTHQPSSILTASWVEDYKQPMHWVDVAEAVLSQLPEGTAMFTWLGDGSQLPLVRQRVNASLYRESIAFPGPTTQVEPWYERSHLYLQLSAIENMSLSTIDAQRHGLPCVVTEVGGLPEIIIDGVNGRVVPTTDVGAAAAAIIELVENQALWERMSRSAREHYEAEHSPAGWERDLAALHAGY